MLDTARAVGRLIVRPLIVAVFTGVELTRYGAFTAVAAAYLAFAATQGAVISWNRYQLQQNRRRLASQRSRRSKARR